MELYRIVNRELQRVRALSAQELATLGPDWDSWLAANGMGGGQFTLRPGVVREVTAAERRALEQWERRAKAAGLLPSALGLIAGKLAADRA
jgi:hypothetical protein